MLAHVMQKMLAHVMRENASLIGLELALVLETDPFSRVLVNKLKNMDVFIKRVNKYCEIQKKDEKKELIETRKNTKQTTTQKIW